MLASTRLTSSWRTASYGQPSSGSAGTSACAPHRCSRLQPAFPVTRLATIVGDSEHSDRGFGLEVELDDMVREALDRCAPHTQLGGHARHEHTCTWEANDMGQAVASTVSRNSVPNPARWSSYQRAAARYSCSASSSNRMARVTADATRLRLGPARRTLPCSVGCAAPHAGAWPPGGLS